MTIKISPTGTVTVSAVSAPVVVVRVQPAPRSVVRVLDGGAVFLNQPLSTEYQIALNAIQAYPITCKTFEYSNGDLVILRVFSDATKTELLLTKTLSYTAGVVTTVTTVFEGVTVVTTLSYNAGDLVESSSIAS